MQYKNGVMTFKYSSEMNFLQRDMHQLSSYAADRFVMPEIESKWRSNLLKYDVDNMVSLSNYLDMMTINRKIFTVIIAQFLDGIGRIDELSLDSRKMLFSLENVFIEPPSQKLWFIYVPIDTFVSEDIADSFLKNLINKAQFSEHENNSYLSEFMSIVNKDRISMFDVSIYINNLSNGKIRTPNQSAISHRCKKCNAIVNGGEQFCPDCGTELFNEKIPCVIRQKTQEKTLLDNTSILMGKTLPECRVFIGDNPLVSRKHAQIQNISGTYYLIDIGSTNGTYIEGQRLIVNAKYKLTSNMKFSLANEEFMFFE